ncbi:hypothetical protein D5018_03710 [Parashewanella curva]|uniref:Uncharacterized protein n=1 Tax=Parashewanella curva TaxID=2338552 RepID=A0A3L8Q276_9GAMM|nr:hypothetical protein [Parashewanella curva]RLV60958.1 hypothetical protein D5018_03710 [Parashewanella curva]
MKELREQLVKIIGETELNGGNSEIVKLSKTVNYLAMQFDMLARDLDRAEDDTSGTENATKILNHAAEMLSEKQSTET